MIILEIKKQDDEIYALIKADDCDVWVNISDMPISEATSEYIELNNELMADHIPFHSLRVC